MRDYNSTYLGRVVNALSQLGNALSGGNPDISISARIGYMNTYKNVSLFWGISKGIVDFTFYPIDGKGHCEGAYLSDGAEDYEIGRGWLPGLVILTILMIFICGFICPFTWVYLGFIKTIKNA